MITGSFQRIKMASSDELVTSTAAEFTVTTGLNIRDRPATLAYKSTIPILLTYKMTMVAKK